MDPAVVRPLESQIRELRKVGVITWINVELNQVRVDFPTWLAMDVTVRQAFVMALSMYFDVKGSTGRVTVLSSLNDREPATCTVWTEIKIKE